MVTIYGFPFPTLAFPVVGMVCVALTAGTYSIIRDINTNPDVRLTKAHKADEMAVLPVGLSRAEGYVKNGVWSSIYAKIGAGYNSSARVDFKGY